MNVSSRLAGVFLLTLVACSQVQSSSRGGSGGFTERHEVFVAPKTFEGWIRDAGIVASGRIDSISEEIGEATIGRYQELQVVFTDVFKGESQVALLKANRVLLFNEVRSWLPPEAVDDEILVVGSMFTFTTVAGTPDSALAAIPQASYRLLTLRGHDLGVRLYSPTAQAYGYRGDHRSMVDRASRIQLRPIDASERTELLRRIEQPPSRERDELGFEDALTLDPLLGEPYPDDWTEDDELNATEP